jgi:hypothetical protein
MNRKYIDRIIEQAYKSKSTQSPKSEDEKNKYKNNQNLDKFKNIQISENLRILSELYNDINKDDKLSKINIFLKKTLGYYLFKYLFNLDFTNEETYIYNNAILNLFYLLAIFSKYDIPRIEYATIFFRNHIEKILNEPLLDDVYISHLNIKDETEPKIESVAITKKIKTVSVWDIFTLHIMVDINDFKDNNIEDFYKKILNKISDNNHKKILIFNLFNRIPKYDDYITNILKFQSLDASTYYLAFDENNNIINLEFGEVYKIDKDITDILYQIDIENEYDDDDDDDKDIYGGKKRKSSKKSKRKSSKKTKRKSSRRGNKVTYITKRSYKRKSLKRK